MLLDAYAVFFIGLWILWALGQPVAIRGLRADTRRPLVRLVIAAAGEVHPFLPYLLLANVLWASRTLPVPNQVVVYVFSAVQLVAWVLNDVDHDDRWKRRRRGLRRAVQSAVPRRIRRKKRPVQPE